MLRFYIHVATGSYLLGVSFTLTLLSRVPDFAGFPLTLVGSSLGPSSFVLKYLGMCGASGTSMSRQSPIHLLLGTFPEL